MSTYIRANLKSALEIVGDCTALLLPASKRRWRLPVLVSKLSVHWLMMRKPAMHGHLQVSIAQICKRAQSQIGGWQKQLVAVLVLRLLSRLVHPVMRSSSIRTTWRYRLRSMARFIVIWSLANLRVPLVVVILINIHKLKYRHWDLHWRICMVLLYCLKVVVVW